MTVLNLLIKGGDGAMKSALKALKNWPSYDDIKMLSAFANIELGKYSLAEEIGKQISDSSLNLEKDNLLAVASFAQGQPERAIPVWEKLSKKYPRNLAVSFNLTTAYLTYMNVKQAKAELGRIEKIFPKNRELTRLSNLTRKL